MNEEEKSAFNRAYVTLKSTRDVVSQQIPKKIDYVEGPIIEDFNAALKALENMGIDLTGFMIADSQIRKYSNGTALADRFPFLSKVDAAINYLEMTPEFKSIFQETKSEEPQRSPRNKKVFVVHGHDEGPRESVARVLEKLDLTPIILFEQPSRSRTIIEKIEHHSDVSFAVILLTPDDIGAPIDEQEKHQPRARQNVILELGYFIGKLGRENLCVLYKDGVEVPSDVHGVGYVIYDENGAWRTNLANELEAAGFDIDRNKL
ncbi:MAG: nucleotide-binding protein [Planctomycetota bacterium]